MNTSLTLYSPDQAGSLWGRLTDDARKRLKDGDAAVGWLKRNESIERWKEVGDGANELQAGAMRLAGVNKATGGGYNKAWAELGQHVPNIVNLDSATRTHAMWMAANWEQVNTWLHTLASNERMRLNHPSAVRRRFDATHKPPSKKADGEGDAEPSVRIRQNDQIVKLQEENDALRGRGGKGTIIIRANASAEDTADALADERNVEFLKKLRRRLDAVIEREERQNRSESASSRKKR